MRAGRLAAALLAGPWLCAGLFSQQTNPASDSREEEARNRSAILFANVVELIREEYLDPEKADYDKMTHAALRGLLSSLDPHSLLPGDRILKIDGQGTQKLTLPEAIRKMRGRPGAPIKLTLYRPSEERTLEVSLVREMIQVPTLVDVGLLPESRTGGEKIGYLRIIQFGEKTAAEFDQALERLTREGAGALVIDLRDNPGGLVDAAVEVVGRFVAPGTLAVSTEGRSGPAGSTKYLTRETSQRVRWPTVVLVNGNSASAAEIVAGALQDLGKALIIGETTFGKGSVQTVQPLAGSVTPAVAVRLTTAHYTTPSRRKIHGVGIEPDIVARMTPAEERTLYQSRTPGLRKAAEADSEVVDEPLDRAVDVLRGWKVVARRTAAAR